MQSKDRVEEVGTCVAELVITYNWQKHWEQYRAAAS